MLMASPAPTATARLGRHNILSDQENITNNKNIISPHIIFSRGIYKNDVSKTWF